MIFVFGCLLLVFIGRKIGWMLSRRFLYSGGRIASGYMCVFYGVPPWHVLFGFVCL